MSVPASCCNTPPVRADYTPKGETIKINDRDCYVVGDKSAKRAIIYIYDIFGFHSNAYQGCDILSAKGFRVFMPDIFKGKPCVESDLGDISRLMGILAERADWDTILLPTINGVKAYLEGEGITKVGLIGFCWGAKMAFRATAESPFFAAVAAVHPSFAAREDFEKSQAPLCLMPSRDDGELKEEYAIAKSKPFGDKCFYHYFGDMHHGFCGARGDWKVEEQRKRAEEALGYAASFFDRTIVV